MGDPPLPQPISLSQEGCGVIVSTLVAGLLSVNYTVNGQGNPLPANLFGTRPASFGFFLVVVSITFYLAMMAMIVRPVMPRVAKVLNNLAFACVVLGVTVLLRSLFPRGFSCVPWIFFGATIFMLLGVTVHEWADHGKRVEATRFVP